MKTNIMHTRVNVKDVVKSTEWYTDILGFKLSTEKSPEGPKYVHFESDGGATFALMEGEDCNPLCGRIDFKVDNIDELWKKVRDKVHVIEEPHPTSYDTRRFTIKDPDGNPLGFVQP